MQNSVIGTEFTFIQLLITQYCDPQKMIPLLLLISASNGKYFLINTNDNDNKTGQDYMMNDDNRAGCTPGIIIPGREVACSRE